MSGWWVKITEIGSCWSEKLHKYWSRRWICRAWHAPPRSLWRRSVLCRETVHDCDYLTIPRWSSWKTRMKMTTLMSPFGRHSQENWYFAYERDLPHLFCHAMPAMEQQPQRLLWTTLMLFRVLDIFCVCRKEKRTYLTHKISHTMTFLNKIVSIEIRKTRHVKIFWNFVIGADLSFKTRGKRSSNKKSTCLVFIFFK